MGYQFLGFVGKGMMGIKYERGISWVAKTDIG
jgi:hypothetical protein